MTETTIYSREEIIAALEEVSLNLIKLISEQDAVKFMVATENKWSTAQQLDHLTRSIKQLELILSKPHFIMKLLFGTANRATRNYKTVVEKYNIKLEQGATTTGQYVPKPSANSNKKKMLDNFARKSEKLERIINRYKENDLDRYVLPHPLLGKLTIREMMFFTIHHIKHHTDATKKQYT